MNKIEALKAKVKKRIPVRQELEDEIMAVIDEAVRIAVEEERKHIRTALIKESHSPQTQYGAGYETAIREAISIINNER